MPHLQAAHACGSGSSNSANGMSCPSRHCLLQDGTWAGQHELVAVARMLPAELRIYQAGQPSWTISSGVTSGKAGGPPLAWPRTPQVRARPRACCRQEVQRQEGISCCAVLCQGACRVLPQSPRCTCRIMMESTTTAYAVQRTTAQVCPCRPSVCAQQQGGQQGAGSACLT